MAVKLGQWTSARAEDSKLRYEKARKTALGIAQGVVLSDLDAQRAQAQKFAYEVPRSVQQRTFRSDVGTPYRDRLLARTQFLREQGLPVDTLDPVQVRSLAATDDQTVLEAVRQKNLGVLGEKGSTPGTLGPRGIIPQLISPVVPTEANPLPGSAGRLTSALTNPVGVGLTAAFPGATAAGTLAGAGLGTVGAGLEKAGVPVAQTPIGGIGPRGVGELVGGAVGPSEIRAGARAATTRIGENLATATEREGGARALLASERGGTQIADEIPPVEPPAPPREPPTGGEPPQSPWQKVTEAVKAAGRARPEQNRMFAQQRAQRTAAAASALERGEGTEAFQAARGNLAGEFKRPQFSTPEIDDASLHQVVEDIRTADAPFYKKIQAQEALDELGRGRIPQPHQLTALQSVNPAADELVKAIQSKRSFGQKALAELVSALGLPQKLKSTFDWGTRFRQAGVLGWSHPRQWLSNWKPVKDSFFTEEAAREVMGNVERNPWYSIGSGENAGLGFTDVGGHIFNWEAHTPGTERVAGFQGVGDSFITKTTDKIPGVLGSQRSFAVDLNKQGVEVYAQEAQALWDAGVRDPDMYKAVAQVIDHARGYGSFNPGQIAQGVHAFFSGRNLVARFQVALDPIVQPGSLFSPSARQLAAKNLVGMVAGDMALLGLLGSIGAATGIGSVEFNPLKPGADWLKVKIGNTRIDPWGGFLPMARLIAHMGAASVTGTGLTDTGYNMADIKRELITFFSNKEAPLVRLLTDMTGVTESFDKRDLNPKLLADLFAPFVAQDVWEAVKEHGWVGAGVAAPAAVGAGVQTYAVLADERNRVANDAFGRDWADLTADEQLEIGPEIAADSKTKNILGRLRTIPEFDGITNDERNEIYDFYKDVQAYQARQDEEWGDHDEDWQTSAESVAEEQGKDQDFLDWAIALHSEKNKTANRNPEYIDFLLEHYDEILAARRASDLQGYGPNYEFPSWLRQLHGKEKVGVK